jgi:hypothetical protein
MNKPLTEKLNNIKNLKILQAQAMLLTGRCVLACLKIRTINNQ